MPDEDLPKQELLIKLLGMTDSSSDNEALMAIRKANQLLRSAGWTWEALIHARIKVIEDPFKNVSDPSSSQKPRRDRDYTRPPPPAGMQPAGTSTGRMNGSGFSGNMGGQTARNPPPPPPPPPPPRQQQPYSSKKNLYANSCYCCGIQVESDRGWIFRPSDFNSRAKDKWEVICDSCNKSHAPVMPTKAKRALGPQTSVDLNTL